MTHSPPAVLRSAPTGLPLTGLISTALALLLVGCGPAVSPDLDLVGTGQASLGGVLVQGEGQAAVAGSRVRLYRAGDHSRTVGQTRTDGDGHFSFRTIPAGQYDLGFEATGSAASELLGAVARETAPLKYAAIQLPVRDPGSVLSVPKLSIIRTDIGQAMSAGTTQAFADRLNLRVRTMPASAHQRPLQGFEVTLLQPADDGTPAPLHPAGGVVSTDPQAEPSDSGPLNLGVSSVSGDALLQVAATDFNNNRVAELIPVTVTGSVGGTVTAPADVSAVAYTLATPAPGGTLKVLVSWNVTSLAGVRGFEVWRSGAATDLWRRVALSEPGGCTGSLCRAVDSSDSLRAGQDYVYRVTAVGQNRVDSLTATQPGGARPVTHPLPLFRPSLTSPAAGQTGLPLAPVYVLHAPLEGIGASGVLAQLGVQDDLLGNSVPWSVDVQLRRVLGQTGQAAGQPDHQVLFARGGGSALAYSSLNPAGNLSGVSYDPQDEQLSLTHNFDNAGTGLQPARRYRMTLGRGAAFRLEDPARPPGAANPVVAYSVYSDPVASGPLACPAAPLVPAQIGSDQTGIGQIGTAGPCLNGGPSLEFTTQETKTGAAP
ncbi:carboxypeptidase-like regulatory domain-containing protein [Deinococcus sp.]|uniref:carboxypeptidase-like regulatory domain-containing protein n=1 Tax=Deinococcus sp. TaxID=47478 RepID=UPI00286E9FC5|nr:carboxypeptidase-like regulatory domain-containing protein [Deinococcus sp.]